jgi:hypothetical protein
MKYLNVPSRLQSFLWSNKKIEFVLSKGEKIERNIWRIENLVEN